MLTLLGLNEVQEEVPREAAGLEPDAQVGQPVVAHNRTLNRDIRTFDGVNTPQIKADLGRHGYL